MVIRKYWHQLINQAWQRRSLIWLAGVRRVGKTLLCKSLPDIEYFDCELPRVRQQLEDAEGFLNSLKGKRIVLDEIHRLSNPSEILKIATDHYKDISIIATGSSTLTASVKFRDSLSGRKTSIWLTPLLLNEMDDFDGKSLQHRMLFGGLPDFFMANVLPEQDYLEWIDAYWARDIQELFHLEKKHSFQKFTELALAQSGSIFEATQFTAPCEVTRPTIMNYLAVLESTYVLNIVRPYSTYKATEIVSAPKIYGFDTGFICYAKGWQDLRNEDLGLLWEHCILNELHAHLQTRSIHYWRDKQKHEIDFIYLRRRNHTPITIECKLSAKKFDPANLKIFRRLYPEGENYLVAADIDRSFVRTYDDLTVHFVTSHDLIAALKTSA